MLDRLTDKLEAIFKKLRGQGHLTEANIAEALREVRLALLEADVHFKVVKDFIERVRQRAVGQEVLGSLTPDQQVVRVVHEELTGLLGGREARLNFAPKPPTVVMLVGLHGSGKTTTAGKLARRLAGERRRALLVAADLRRPAAIEQLKALGQRLGLPVLADRSAPGPVAVCRAAVAQARAQGFDLVFLDTAGRLHVAEDLMAELVAIRDAVQPTEILMVVDAMTGQDAVQSAAAFHAALGLTGFVLTKLDGDAKGGAALSIRAVTGTPIKFVGLGEKLDALEVFHPERMASRLLGLGDVLSLVEKAQAAFDAERAREVERKLRTDQFTLEDFRQQLGQVQQMGPLDQLLGMVPGLKKLRPAGDLDPEARELGRMAAIIDSMTPRERRQPAIIDGSRRKRIAAGSGTTVADVNRLLKQFAQTQKMVKQVMKLGRGGRLPRGVPPPLGLGGSSG
jgi:signal recognition particle subunit SRP54